MHTQQWSRFTTCRHFIIISPLSLARLLVRCASRRSSDNRKIAVDYVRYLFPPLHTSRRLSAVAIDCRFRGWFRIIYDFIVASRLETERGEEMKNDGNATHLILMK